MPDKRKSHIRAVNPRRRRIGIGARRPFRPSLTLPAGPELPAEDLPERFGRHSIGIKELRSIEMVRERAGIVFRAVGPGGQTDQSGDPREQSEKSATGDFHGPIRPQNRGFGKGPAAICSYENLSGPTFLDFWGVRGFNARNLRKEVLF